MKKNMITGALFLLGLTAFCQQEENGTIYIKHPYIDAINNATKAYEGQDWAAMKNFYSDTAKWLLSGMPKFIPIADAMKEWKGDFEHFDGVKQVPQGYPDYLHYKNEGRGNVEIISGSGMSIFFRSAFIDLKIKINKSKKYEHNANGRTSL
jgi:hypothetical protein